MNMINFIRRVYHTEADSEEVRWLPRANDLMRQFDAINNSVQQAARSDNTDFMLSTFDSALAGLPKIARRLQSIKPRGEQERDACYIFSEGLNSYMQACECFRKSLLEDSEEHYARANTYMNDAGQLLKEALRLLRQFSQR